LQAGYENRKPVERIEHAVECSPQAMMGKELMIRAAAIGGEFDGYIRSQFPAFLLQAGRSTIQQLVWFDQWPEVLDKSASCYQV
jgi:hypothetical protein